MHRIAGAFSPTIALLRANPSLRPLPWIHSTPFPPAQTDPRDAYQIDERPTKVYTTPQYPPSSTIQPSLHPQTRFLPTHPADPSVPPAQSHHTHEYPLSYQHNPAHLRNPPVHTDNCRRPATPEHFNPKNIPKAQAILADANPSAPQETKAPKEHIAKPK